MPLQYAPVLSTESIRHVHHILVFLCEGLNYTGHSEVGARRECDGISLEVEPCRFSTVIAAWAIGGSVSIHLIIYMHTSYIRIILCMYVCKYLCISFLISA